MAASTEVQATQLHSEGAASCAADGASEPAGAGVELFVLLNTPDREQAPQTSATLTVRATSRIAFSRMVSVRLTCMPPPFTP
jgi:hypothetical protein